MRVTKFSRVFWETVAACRGVTSLKTILRDYDIIKLRESGKTIGQIAIKYDLTERYIIIILNKYK